jgi:hypothetical protein
MSEPGAVPTTNRFSTTSITSARGDLAVLSENRILIARGQIGLLTLKYGL